MDISASGRVATGLWTEPVTAAGRGRGQVVGGPKMRMQMYAQTPKYALYQALVL